MRKYKHYAISSICYTYIIKGNNNTEKSFCHFDDVNYHFAGKNEIYVKWVATSCLIVLDLEIFVASKQ